jgi:hypothetical protein
MPSSLAGLGSMILDASDRHPTFVAHHRGRKTRLAAVQQCLLCHCRPLNGPSIWNVPSCWVKPESAETHSMNSPNAAEPKRTRHIPGAMSGYSRALLSAYGSLFEDECSRLFGKRCRGWYRRERNKHNKHEVKGLFHCATGPTS